MITGVRLHRVRRRRLRRTDRRLGVLADEEHRLRRTSDPGRCRAASAGRAPAGRRHDPPLGCRISVHCNTFHRYTDAGRADPVGRNGRGCPRQRVGRNHHRAVQNRVRARGLTVSHRAAATLADLEDITSAWVHWYNASRLMHRLGRRPPAEAEAEYYAQQPIGQHTDHT